MCACDQAERATLTQISTPFPLNNRPDNLQLILIKEFIDQREMGKG